jgi:sugar lactone lactonase YvrE
MNRLSPIGCAVLALFFAISAQAQNIKTTAGGGPNNLPALSSNLAGPTSTAMDSAGNLYIAADDRVFKVDTSGNLTVFAGNGARGFSGDGGLATSAALNGPNGVTVDSAGDLFIVDGGNNAIRRVDATTGNISTVAGTPGVCGFSGDGGLATSARLCFPTGVALDSTGDIFISDSDNSVIRFVAAATGNISTVAGTPGVFGFSGDGGPATSAVLNGPFDVALDSAGDIFITDDNQVIRRVDATTGIISTVAGTPGVCGFSGDGGLATSARLCFPTGVALDSAGDLFIADLNNSVIRFVAAATGNISTVAGTPGLCSFGGDGGPATNARLCFPTGVALDSAGDLIIADTDNFRIRTVSASTGNIATRAGNGFFGFSGDGVLATDGSLNDPFGVAVDADNNAVVADGLNNVIRRVDAVTGHISTAAGTPGVSGFSGDGGPAASAQLNLASGVAVDSVGDLFFADVNNNVIRRVDAVSGNISTVAGTPGVTGFSGDGGPATSARLTFPEDVAVDSAGDLFIADSGNCVIRRVDAKTGDISTVAGNNALGCGFSGDGGPATSATLDCPEGVALDSAGDLIIADTQNSVIRFVAAATGIISTVAGTSGVSGFSGDGGPATSAQLNLASGVAVDSAGNLFIADSFNSVIRFVAAATGIISTIAGTPGVFNFSGDGGPATSAALNLPTSVAVDRTGNLFIADTFNNRIRAVTPAVSVSATGLAFGNQVVATTSAGQTITLTNNTASSLAVSTVAATGDFAETDSCVAAAVPAAGTCTVTVKFSPVNPVSETATLTITSTASNSPQVISVSGSGVNFALAAASGGSTTATVSAGGTTTYNLQLTELGDSGAGPLTANLKCTGAPTNATCNVVSPATATTSAPGAFTVTVTTMAPAFVPLAPRPPWPTGSKPLIPLALLLALASIAWRMAGTGARRPTRQLVGATLALATLAVLLAAGGCGSSKTGGTPAGTFMLTVTATEPASGATRTITLTLTVTR